MDIFKLTEKFSPELLKEVMGAYLSLQPTELKRVNQLIKMWMDLQDITRTQIESIVVGLSQAQKVALIKVLTMFLPKQLKDKARLVIRVIDPSILEVYTDEFINIVATPEGIQASRSILDLVGHPPPSRDMFVRSNASTVNNQTPSSSSSSSSFENELCNSWFKAENGVIMHKDEKGVVTEAETNLQIIEMVVLADRQPHLEEPYENLKLIEKEFLKVLGLIVSDLSPGKNLPGDLEPPFHYMALLKVVPIHNVGDTKPRWAKFDKDRQGYRLYTLANPFDDSSTESIRLSFPNLILLAHHRGDIELPIDEVYNVAIRFKQPASAVSNFTQFLQTDFDNQQQTDFDAIFKLVEAISYATCYSPIDTLSMYLGETINYSAQQAWSSLVNSQEYKNEKRNRNMLMIEIFQVLIKYRFSINVHISLKNMEEIIKLSTKYSPQFVKAVVGGYLSLGPLELKRINQFINMWLGGLKESTRTEIESIVVGLSQAKKVAMAKTLSTYMPRQLRKQFLLMINQIDPSILETYTDEFINSIVTPEGIETSKAILKLLRNQPSSNDIFANTHHYDSIEIDHEGNQAPPPSSSPPLYEKELCNNWFRDKNGTIMFKNQQGIVEEAATNLQVIEMVVLADRQPHLEEPYENQKMIEEEYLKVFRLMAEDLSPGKVGQLPGNLQPPFHYMALLKVVPTDHVAEPRWAIFDKDRNGYQLYTLGGKFDDSCTESIRLSFPKHMLLAHHHGEDIALPIDTVYNIAIQFKQPASAISNIYQFLQQGDEQLDDNQNDFDAIFKLVESIGYATCFSPIDTLSTYLVGETISHSAQQAWNSLVNSQEYKNEKKK
ncbi:hypothetical protein DFA_09681 [Cavenderia fasciculata]|uniref:Uncharacterized protein n=1 Tax=Cavenderia fasciculata TaxID=261658 RepID=F4Q8A9_CACFS|nr:uncharacterized protein DFA_09681 [Cavenderia fasciculata]EGG16009.1 hypothetical protein DFA_09681 [Cavenderia fasciculata]|eukprot:XP_004352334.1 hypothetical protein DFA_09681 [Cavenderia fasciculata]